MELSVALLLSALLGACLVRTQADMLTTSSASDKQSKKPEVDCFNNSLELLKGRLDNTMDRFTRPDVDGPPVDVRVNFFISSFSDIDEINMDYKLSIYLRQIWTDPRMRYTRCDGQSGSLSLPAAAADKMWTPALFFPNEKQASVHHVTVPNTLIRIYPNGTMVKSVRVTLTLSCPMDLSSFPMDRQQCSMRIESFNYERSQLTLSWDDDPVEYDEDLELPQFALQDHIETSNCSKTYKKMGSFPCLVAKFELHRQYGYFLLQTYIPSVLIVILSWVSFWINMDAVPARISLGVTTVLTMATQLSGSKQSIPKVSYPKAIDIWMSICMVSVFAALLEYAFVNALSRRVRKTRRDNGPLPGEKESLSMSVIDGSGSPNSATPPPACEFTADISLAYRVDQVSRVLFPAVFIFLNLLYWPIYILRPSSA